MRSAHFSLGSLNWLQGSSRAWFSVTSLPVSFCFKGAGEEEKREETPTGLAFIRYRCCTVVGNREQTDMKHSSAQRESLNRSSIKRPGKDRRGPLKPHRQEEERGRASEE